MQARRGGGGGGDMGGSNPEVGDVRGTPTLCLENWPENFEVGNKSVRVPPPPPPSPSPAPSAFSSWCGIDHETPTPWKNPVYATASSYYCVFPWADTPHPFHFKRKTWECRCMISPEQATLQYQVPSWHACIMQDALETSTSKCGCYCIAHQSVVTLILYFRLNNMQCTNQCCYTLPD